MYQIQYLLRCVLLLVVMLPFCACDNLLDPTGIENTQITEENLLESPEGATESLVNGLRQQLSEATAAAGAFTDVVSDNVDNVLTVVISPDLDFPRLIRGSTFTLNSSAQIYFRTQQLRALADFGINRLAPIDPLITVEQRAEIHFHKGMALLMLSENFSVFPIEEDGPAVTAFEARRIAIDQFRQALALDSNSSSGAAAVRFPSRFALARAYRMQGNRDSAGYWATEALARSGKTYLYSVSPTANVLQVYYASASGQYQPLPRLDFLDPKFARQTTPIAALKSEEAYLIIAEVALSNGDLPKARSSMSEAAAIARSRPTTEFRDPDARSGRPGESDIVVRADANANYVPNLVIARKGLNVQVYPVSFTNQTADSIKALATKPLGDHVYTLYLLRQHIFFGEGRRMSDLGIRLPVMLRQSETNPAFSPGAPGTETVVPDYIPQSDEMDRFSITENRVTILWDMNRVISENISRVSPLPGF